jgi:hypothetical protein
LIRALERIAQIESPLKGSLRGVAPLFIVDPFECGSASWAEYLDEVARIESHQDARSNATPKLRNIWRRACHRVSFRARFRAIRRYMIESCDCADCCTKGLSARHNFHPSHTPPNQRAHSIEPDRYASLFARGCFEQRPLFSLRP